MSLGEFWGSLGVFEGFWESVGLWMAFKIRDIKDKTFWFLMQDETFHFSHAE